MFLQLAPLTANSDLWNGKGVLKGLAYFLWGWVECHQFWANLPLDLQIYLQWEGRHREERPIRRWLFETVFLSISQIDSNPEQTSLLACRSDCREKAWRGSARETAAAVWNWLPAFSEKLSTFNSFHFYTDAEKRTQNISFFCRNAMQWPPKSVMRGQNIFVKSYADLLLWRCLYSFATFFV